MHFRRWQRTGDPTKLRKGIPNRHAATLDGDGILIMTRPDGTGHAALYDMADHNMISARHWGVQSNGYIRRGNTGLLLHRFLLGLKPGDLRQGDHINGDVLDNRRANLRAVSQQRNIGNQAVENRIGTSRYRGVSWSKRRHLWYAHQRWDGYMHQVGLFPTEEAAAAAVAEFRVRHGLPSGY